VSSFCQYSVNCKVCLPQGLVLGPVLIVMYTTNMDDNLTNALLKFADDVKHFASVWFKRDIKAIYPFERIW